MSERYKIVYLNSMVDQVRDQRHQEQLNTMSKEARREWRLTHDPFVRLGGPVTEQTALNTLIPEDYRIVGMERIPPSEFTRGDTKITLERINP